MNINKVQYWEVEEDSDGQRVDNYLQKRLKNVPKSHIYKIIRKGEVRVNKGRVKPTTRLYIGDTVRIPPIKLTETVEVTPSEGLQERLKQAILYEDESVMVINKPAGMAVHGGSGLKGGVIECLRVIFPQLKQLELVHRLDRATSGCLLLAKKRSILTFLHEAFKADKVHKSYWALTQGHWLKKDYRVELALSRSIGAAGERIVRVDRQEGKEALTQFSSVERFESTELVQAKLYSGRTHQIRVHCQAMGHAIVGDEKYGDRAVNAKMKRCGLSRMFLHAVSLKFPLPGQTDQVRVRAPLPSDLESVLEALRD